MADLIGKARRKVHEEVGKHKNWWELPLPLQMAALKGFREELREFNLYDMEQAVENGEAAADGPPPDHRTYDGSRTDPDHPRMGKSGTRFGRNMMPDRPHPTEQDMLDPSPRDV